MHVYTLNADNNITYLNQKCYNFMQIGVFDLNSDDPLKLSSIVGEAVVSCWSVEKILPAQTKGKSNH